MINSPVCIVHRLCKKAICLFLSRIYFDGNKTKLGILGWFSFEAKVWCVRDLQREGSI